MLRITALCLSLLSFSAFASAPAHVIFGDSLSDEGRIYEITHQAYPPSPFYEGRFSNGPVWAEHLEGERLNYATGGAKSDYDNILSSSFGSDVDNTGLFGQVDQFVQQNWSADDLANAYFYISVGGNDFFDLLAVTDGSIERFVPTIVDNIIYSAIRLKDEGATNIVLIGLPNMAKVPFANNMSFKQQQAVGLASWKFNQLLKTQAEAYGFIYKDADAFMKKLVKNASKYGFTNTGDVCFDEATGTVCDNPDEYLYWDDVHPSAKVHQLFAESFIIQK